MAGIRELVDENKKAEEKKAEEKKELDIRAEIRSLLAKEIDNAPSYYVSFDWIMTPEEVINHPDYPKVIEEELDSLIKAGIIKFSGSSYVILSKAPKIKCEVVYYLLAKDNTWKKDTKELEIPVPFHYGDFVLATLKKNLDMTNVEDVFIESSKVI